MARTPLKCIKSTIKMLSQSRGAELATDDTANIFIDKSFK